MVYATETRPLLQGSRLTAWELGKAGLPHRILVDGAAAGLILAGEVDAVVVGADRIAANGDTANKVGTVAHALAAARAEHPVRGGRARGDVRGDDVHRGRDTHRGAARGRGAVRGFAPRRPARYAGEEPRLRRDAERT
nr:hypothetical protein GCM10020092_053380 [Actinoplanes digitatis]